MLKCCLVLRNVSGITPSSVAKFKLKQLSVKTVKRSLNGFNFNFATDEGVIPETFRKTRQHFSDIQVYHQHREGGAGGTEGGG